MLYSSKNKIIANNYVYMLLNNIKNPNLHSLIFDHSTLYTNDARGYEIKESKLLIIKY